MRESKLASKNHLRRGHDVRRKVGWKWRFCQRHGIHSLKERVEKASAHRPATENFISFFQNFVKREALPCEQLFNCDETGLNFRLLPRTAIATAAKKTVSGLNASKERVTLNVCSDHSGTRKLPLQMIGKSQRPRLKRISHPWTILGKRMHR